MLPPNSPPPPALLFLQLGGRPYLEGILLGKVQNQVPPLPSGIGGIKHLGREPVGQRNGDRETQSHRAGPRAERRSEAAMGVETGKRQVRLTAICPLSSVRYAFTSSSATRAHCLPRQRRKSARGRSQGQAQAQAEMGTAGVPQGSHPFCSVSPQIKNFLQSDLSTSPLLFYLPGSCVFPSPHACLTL